MLYNHPGSKTPEDEQMPVFSLETLTKPLKIAHIHQKRPGESGLLWSFRGRDGDLSVFERIPKLDYIILPGKVCVKKLLLGHNASSPQI